MPRVNFTPVNAAPSTNPPHNMDHLQRLAHRLSLVDKFDTALFETNQGVQAPWDEIGPRGMEGNRALRRRVKIESRQQFITDGAVDKLGMLRRK